jgi:hypothetical protein
MDIRYVRGSRDPGRFLVTLGQREQGKGELGLPFFDKIMATGWEFTEKTLDENMAAAKSRYGEIGESAPVPDVDGGVEQSKGALGRTMSAVHEHLGTVVGRLRGSMPSVINITGSVTGVLATAMGALPAWRYLGGRLAAEACVSAAGGKSTTARGPDESRNMVLTRPSFEGNGVHGAISTRNIAV